MSNILLVHVADSEKELLDSIGCLALSKPLNFNDVVVEFSTCHKFSHDIEIGLILQEFKDADHVRMVCLLKYIELLLHQINQDLVLPNMRLAYCLHGACDSCQCIQALSYLSKGTFTEDSAYLILCFYISRVPETFKETELKNLFASSVIYLSRT